MGDGSGSKWETVHSCFTWLYVSICKYLTYQLSICLSIYLFVSLYIFSYLYLSISVYIYLYLSISTYLHISIIIYLYITYTSRAKFSDALTQAGFQLRQPRAPEEPRLLPGSPDKTIAEDGISRGNYHELPQKLTYVVLISFIKGIFVEKLRVTDFHIIKSSWHVF